MSYGREMSLTPPRAVVPGACSGRAGRVRVSYLLLPAILLVSSAHVGASMPEAMRPIVRFMTGQTAVSNAIVEVRFDVNPPVFVQCRDQANAYYIRLLASPQDAATPVSSDDQVCGRWNHSYWYHEPNDILGPTLYRTEDTRGSTNSMAFQRQAAYLKALLTGFRTLGLTPDSTARLEWDEVNIVLHDVFRDQVIVPRFLMKDGIPSGFELTRVIDGIACDLAIDFEYQAASGAPNIPSAAISRGHAMDITVHSLTLLPEGRTLPNSLFAIPEVLRGDSIAQVLYTNGMDYSVLRDGRLFAMDARLPEREIAQRDFGRRFFIGGVILLTLCLLPLLIAARRKQRSASSNSPG